MSSRRIPAGRLAVVAVVWLALLTAPPPAAAAQQPAHDAPAASAQRPTEPEHGTPSQAGVQAEAGRAQGAGEGHGAESHGESIWSFLSRIANFLILVGGLYYLLRSPLGRYLDARAQQIQSDLVTAADTRRDATQRMTEIEARLAALPGAIDALKARGREEAVAEQERIRLAAEAERQRLLEQTRREIDRQLQIARRDLTAHAADLAVGVARARLERELTGEQQMRLIDRYVTQVGDRHE